MSGARFVPSKRTAGSMPLPAAPEFGFSCQLPGQLPPDRSNKRQGTSSEQHEAARLGYRRWSIRLCIGAPLAVGVVQEEVDLRIRAAVKGLRYRREITGIANNPGFHQLYTMCDVGAETTKLITELVAPTKRIIWCSRREVGFCCVT